MIPALPADGVRAAIAAEDWDLASELLQAHEGAVVAALAGIDLDTAPRAPWLELLAAQRALAAELVAAREDVAHALARLGQDQRAARAWMRALA
jgi:hypothetical protein